MHRRTPAIALGTGLVLLIATFILGGVNRRTYAASTSLSLSESCQSDGTDGLTFTWQGSDQAALQQWVDVSTSNIGWQPGTFVSNGPLPAGMSSVAWMGFSAGSTYYARVNQLMPNGSWDPSPTFAFVTGCGSYVQAPANSGISQGTTYTAPSYTAPSYPMPTQSMMAPSYVPHPQPNMMMVPYPGNRMMGPMGMR